MSLNTKTVPMVYIIDDFPIDKLVKEIITRSSAVGAHSICFISKKDSCYITSSNGKDIIPIEVSRIENEGRSVFFAIVKHIKTLLGMSLTVKACQFRSYRHSSCRHELVSDLPTFTAVASSNSYGEDELFLTLSFSNYR